MFRLYLILSFCVIFFMAGCSSSNEDLNDWFNDQDISTSYGKLLDSTEIPITFSKVGFDSSAYLVSSFAALGNANGIELSLYFGLEITDSISSIWKFRTDSIFYSDIYGGNVPNEQKTIDAKMYWLKEDSTQYDSLWLKFGKTFTDSADIQLEWKEGNSRDTFFVKIPENLQQISQANGDTLAMQVYIKPLFDGVLRITQPDTNDIHGLFRAAQNTRITEDCGFACLHSGIRESINVELNLNGKLKEDKTIVFAELILPKQSTIEGNELSYPQPIYVYSITNNRYDCDYASECNYIEDYRVDSAYILENKSHPNLVFLGNDLKLQVTRGLRNHASLESNAAGVNFTLKFGMPMLHADSLYFYNSVYGPKILADRPAYSKYDFSSITTAKLKVWYADYGNKK